MTRTHLRGPVLLDFESRSHAKLKDIGGRNYWLVPSSEVIVAVLRDLDTRTELAWVPGDPLPDIDVAVAHNATGFDRFAADAAGWNVRQWVDSAHAACKSGLPRKLEETSFRLLGRHKDEAGNKLVKSLSRASRAKATFGQLPTITPEILARVSWYCADDVEVISDAWDQLEPWVGVDADVGAVDRDINDRGIALDVELIRAMQTLQSEWQEQAVAAAAKRLGWSVADTRRIARSPVVFAGETDLPNAQAETLTDYVKDCERKGEEPHALVSARQALASIIPGKLVAALDRVSPDGRLRDSHLYYGAHTGRWSSKGVQLQNLTRVEVHGGAEMIERLVQACKRGRVSNKLLREAFPKGDPRALFFAAMIRAALIASDDGVLSVLDYSGIEARVTAWLAGDQRALDVFRAYDAGQGPDPYCVMASRIFSRPISKKENPDERQVGKAAELMLGYGAGAPKFGSSCEDEGTDLSAHGTSAGEVVAAWRELHKPIVQFWYACQDAFVAAAVDGKVGRAGPCRFEPHGDDVWCVLPSGRPVVYREATAKRVKRQGRRGMYETWALSYHGHKNGRSMWQHIYGGKFTENIAQAVSRDLLADALVRLNADGLDPVMHCHDEACCDVQRRYAKEAHAEHNHIMSTPPKWARGIPVVVAGFVEERYRK